MSACVGIDLSSRAIDIVKLDETTNQAEWHRFEMEGATAWERTLRVRDVMPPSRFWDDVYLAAVETPFPDQQGVLRRVQGAVMACVPPAVLVWEANASEWKRALGLGTAKPTTHDLARIAPSGNMKLVGRRVLDVKWDEAQNGRDAYCIALWCRETNRRGIEAA